MSKYKSEWKAFELNQAFWEEVLVGRTIKSLRWDDTGIKALVLDSGEEILLVGQASGRICIVDEDLKMPEGHTQTARTTPGPGTE
jgi:hypothetical protein